MLPVENASLQPLFSSSVHVLAHSAARLTTGAPFFLFFCREVGKQLEKLLLTPSEGGGGGGGEEGEECIPALKASHNRVAARQKGAKTTET